MTVRLQGRVVHLSGDCGSEDAEILLSALLAHPDVEIDWRSCERAHTAVVQVLLAAGRRLSGPPPSAFLARWLEPLLRNG
jgi:hypothetical protein